MEVYRRPSWLLLLLGVSLLATTLQGVQGEVESEGPSESECRPYIEKALKELDTGTPETGESTEDIPTVEITTDDSDHPEGDGDDDTHEDGKESTESTEADAVADEQLSEQEETQEDKSLEGEDEQDKETGEASAENDDKKSEETDDNKSGEADQPSTEATEDTTGESVEDKTESKEDAETSHEEKQTEEDQTESKEQPESKEDQAESQEAVEESEIEQEEAPSEIESEPQNDEPQESTEEKSESKEDEQTEASKEDQAESKEDAEASKEETTDTNEDTTESKEGDTDSAEDKVDSKEDDKTDTGSVEDENKTEEADDSKPDDGDKTESQEENQSTEEKEIEDGKSVEEAASKEDEKESKEDDATDTKSAESKEEAGDDKQSTEDEKGDSKEDAKDESDGEQSEEAEDGDEKSGEGSSEAPEEDLTLDIEIPSELRPREHVEHLLKIDEEASETEDIINRVSEITLRELKKLYENAIKPLEVLYKYRDLSNRHFGDAEIFSKPLILFMGPWSGGKSSIINYLVDNEYNETSLRTGAEPSPAYFNILMHGDETEVIDGTQLAADFTFSGLQKFGQGLEERLRGLKLPHRLLEKVNIVEIPGILEVRKQVSRVFPFNDACQWFIDRADIIFLVYDPSKLDVGPETEAILDQLKGREHQTRIILNKADQVKPEELMRVQGALIWNISPLMSSPQPPVMYTTSLWSRPYESWAPVRLLQAQERAFLRDLRSAVDKRIENKIASARRFAVRVRNHAKMVDCYLTTYYNHKSVFGNRKQVADEIIEHPQDYHIYEGLSTLTNISRYDLPDPDVYRDFFKLNPLYDFQQLSATCTYFRGCPINRLDIAIAYDLPELVGKHRRLVETALAEAGHSQTSTPGS